MNNCKEFALDDAMAVIAIPVADMPAGDEYSPVNTLTPVLSDESFAPVLANAVTIGVFPAIAGGTLVPIRHGTGKAKDEESDSAAGRLHTVTVTCEADDRESQVWNDLLTLERTPSHLLLAFRDGTRAFVAASEDTYLCNTERDGSKTTVTFKVQCLMGIQLIA